eukprot:365080-Chlamydomonas_euryale.AAC.1
MHLEHLEASWRLHGAKAVAPPSRHPPKGQCKAHGVPCDRGCLSHPLQARNSPRLQLCCAPLAAARYERTQSFKQVARCFRVPGLATHSPQRIHHCIHTEPLLGRHRRGRSHGGVHWESESCSAIKGMGLGTKPGQHACCERCEMCDSPNVDVLPVVAD